METGENSMNVQLKTSALSGSIVDRIQPSQTSFYIKVGRGYTGVYFTLDPAVVQFSDSECLNSLVTGRNVDLKKLEEVFKKCPSIENLKFMGIRINKELVALIAENCPQLKNLELNLFEPFLIDYKKLELYFVKEVMLLLRNCKEIGNLIIRQPSDEIEDLMRANGFGYDNVDRNYFFGRWEKSKYDISSHEHRNVNLETSTSNGKTDN